MAAPHEAALPRWRAGVDGGGSGTRVCLLDAQGCEQARGQAGPSGLGRGVTEAWAAIEAALDQAFATLGRARPPRSEMALGAGLAGANHAPWAQAWLQADPGYAHLRLASDAWTTLLGAHAGAPGAVLAVGTGSVGAALARDGRQRQVGGWGFPSGDEGSGAWLGLHAVAQLQQALDGRRPPSGWTHALLATCGGSTQALLAWQAQATPAHYAGLAPLVLRHAADDPQARRLLAQAGRHLARMARALDPQGRLPLALCGGLAQPLLSHLPDALQRRASAPLHDATWGALHLLDDARLPGAEATRRRGPCRRTRTRAGDT